MYVKPIPTQTAQKGSPFISRFLHAPKFSGTYSIRADDFRTAANGPRKVIFGVETV